MALTSNTVNNRGRLPVKRTINLAGAGEKPMNLKIAIPAIILIVLAAALFSKFGVVDRLIAVSRAQGEASKVRQELEQAYAKMASYGELTEKYAHYTYSGMTAEELSRADRIEVIDMISRVIMPQATVDNWTVNGNTLTISITGSTLQEINEIAQQLEAEEIVDFCTVTTAATNDVYTTSSDYVRSDIVVTARVIVYLNSANRGE